MSHVPNTKCAETGSQILSTNNTSTRGNGKRLTDCPKVYAETITENGPRFVGIYPAATTSNVRVKSMFLLSGFFLPRPNQTLQLGLDLSFTI